MAFPQFYCRVYTHLPLEDARLKISTVVAGPRVLTAHPSRRGDAAMNNKNSRTHAAILGGMIVLILASTCPSAWCDPVSFNDLKVTSGDNQDVAVPEGTDGILTWNITNQGKEIIVLDNGFRGSTPAFSYTGGDNDDDVGVTKISGCEKGVILAASGGRCTLVVSFTTPFEPDTKPDENSDRGFWDLLSNKAFPTLSGRDALDDPEISDPLRGHVEVDDPGVKAITPEPPPIVTLGLGFLVFGLARWAFKESNRNPAARQAGL